MAQELQQSDVSPTFRSNGSDDPDTDEYNAWVPTGSRAIASKVGGMVAAPRFFTLAELRALPARTQITRHDCVEGWSAIAKWTRRAAVGTLLDARAAAARVRAT